MDDLDAMMGGEGAPASTTSSTTSTGGAPTLPPMPVAVAAAPQPMDEDDEEDDEEDGGVALVLDAPSAAATRGVGAFGTPINIKTQQRYSRWGTPATQGQTPNQATPSTTAAPPSAVNVVSSIAPSTSASSSIPFPSLNSVASTSGAPSTTAGLPTSSNAPTGASSARPFRLPLPNDNIFDAGQHLDQRIERPWTLPGADPSDYFNYGFDEETWKLYCQKQIQQRINIKMKGKLHVFEGEGEVPSMRQNRLQPVGSTQPPQQQMRPPQPRPNYPSGGQNQQRGIQTYDGDY